MTDSSDRIIRTERLVLAPHAPEDYQNCLAIWSNPEVVRFITGKPSNDEEGWARFLRFFGLWAVLGYGYWTLREAATGDYVGEVGFGDFHRQMEPAFGSAPEIGWVLGPRAQGKGYASEAVKAVLQWLEARRGRERTVCMINEDNTPSIRVADKAGYREFARTDYHGKPVILYERT